MNPFDRRRRIGRDDALEAALRDSLAANARQAPDPDAVTARILAAADQAPATGPASRGPWRTWGLPLVAAASVVAIVSGAFAISHYHPESNGMPAADSTAPTPSVSVPSTPASTTDPTTSTSSPATPSSSASTPVDRSTLHNVHVLDLTFTGEDDGWGLASADCIGGSGTCTAVIRTTDGTSWHSHANTPFNVPDSRGDCAAPCVYHVRFANSDIGYVYGPDALFMTTNGAQSWTRLSGGADALETLDGNVIRVVVGSGLHVETAELGSSAWTSTALGGRKFFTDGVQLSRGGSDAYVLARLNPGGGGENQRSTLFRSLDDGASWVNLGEPCQQTAATEIDSSSVAAGVGGRVSLMCNGRHNRTSFVAESSDAGSRFNPGGQVPIATSNVVTGDPDTVLLAAGNGVSRSTDGGQTWTHVDGVPDKDIAFVGFESPTVGRVMTGAGRAIWTTRDAGKTWTKVKLG